MVIPIEESLIYVRPLYLRSQNGLIPELTRVIVAYQNQIVMEPTLEAGLTRIFGRGPTPPSAPSAPSAATGATGAAGATGATGATGASGANTAELITEARAVYERALAAQRAGDWAKYGEEIKRLGEILSQMK